MTGRPLSTHKNAESSVETDSWTTCLGAEAAPRFRGDRLVVGVLPGEGVGPEVVACALESVEAVVQVSGLRLDLRYGGAIGRDSEAECGQALSSEVVDFCRQVFDAGGAVLNGPGGGRYVYDLRKELDLFFKISPLCAANGAEDAGRLRPESVRGVDILVTRENSGGAYQGPWDEQPAEDGQRAARHFACYTESQVRRFLDASARLAASRKGDLTVVWKESGVPTISRLWADCAADSAKAHGVRHRMVDVDLMAYRLIQDAAAFDVVATPNLCGDVLADLGAVLLGSRGASYSGNYTQRGEAVYQTNHGAAYDLAGLDRANPVGQILSGVMMLRESYGLWREAASIEEALRGVLREGWRTADMAGPESRVVGTRELSGRVAEKARRLMTMHWADARTLRRKSA